MTRMSSRGGSNEISSKSYTLGPALTSEDKNPHITYWTNAPDENEYSNFSDTHNLLEYVIGP